MWALPDIKVMNERAAANAKNLKRRLRRGPGKRRACEVYGCGGKAFESVPWFDVFSDIRKGLNHVCTQHAGEDVEGFFRCEGCQRVMIDHITWVRYQVELNGTTLCLKCAAGEYFKDPANWIDPKLVKDAGFADNGVPLFDPMTGFLNLARCKHVLGVEQTPPAGVKFHDNAEFDFMDAHQISGEHPLAIIARLDGQEFCPVVDAAYQFTASIGFYVRQPVEKLAVAA